MRDIFTIFTVQIRIQWISRKSHLKQKVEIKFSKNLWKSVSMTENSPKQIENGKLYIDAKRWKIIVWDKNLKLSMYQFSSSGQYVGFSFRIFHFISSRLYLVCNFNLSLLSAFSFWCFWRSQRKFILNHRTQNLLVLREPRYLLTLERTELWLKLRIKHRYE